MLFACLVLQFVIFAGGSRIQNDRIVGGKPIDIEDAPYQAKLKITTSYGSYWCGGSIIARNVIVTAAHCVLERSTITVVVGTKIFDKGGMVYNVSKHKRHEKYDDPHNDIALLWLSKDLQFNKNVAPIELPSTEDIIEDGTMCSVTGWGRTSENGDTSVILHKVSVPIVNQKICINAHVPIGKIVTNDMICAGYMGKGGKDACQGDSGGPLVAKGKLIGIVSWGEGCARPEFPGVYTRVMVFRKWIDKHLN